MHIEKLEIAGPGFLNITLTQAAYTTLCKQIFEQPAAFFKLPDTVTRLNYSVEFVSANPTGPLHFGHGRGGIIGDVLAKVMRFVGHELLKNFISMMPAYKYKNWQNHLKFAAYKLWDAIDLPEDSYHGSYLENLAQQCILSTRTLREKSDDFFAMYAQTHMLAHIQKTLAAYGITFDVWFSEKTLHTRGPLTMLLNCSRARG